MPQQPYNPDNDYYDLLGIAAHASADDIQKAFRQKAKVTHPDRNPDQSERATSDFQRLNEAYAVLSDPLRRHEYDRKRWPHTRQPANEAGHRQRRPYHHQPSHADFAGGGDPPPDEPEFDRVGLWAVLRTLLTGPFGWVYVVVAAAVLLMPLIAIMGDGLAVRVEHAIIANRTTTACPSLSAQITSPAEGAVITPPLDIVGNADGPYRITYQPLSENTLSWPVLIESDEEQEGVLVADVDLPVDDMIVVLAVDADGDGHYGISCERGFTVTASP